MGLHLSVSSADDLHVGTSPSHVYLRS
jgi:hypothetical protein